MKIISIYISRHFRTGGQKRFLELLEGLSKRGDTVYLLKDLKVDLPLKKIKTFNLDIKEKGISRDFAFSKTISKTDFPGDLEADIILQFGESSILSLRVLKKRFKKPVVFAVRNNWVEANRLIRKLWKKNVKNLLKNAAHAVRDRIKEKMVSGISDDIVFQSHDDMEAFVRRTGFKGREHIIPNSVRAGWFNETYRLKNRSEKLENIVFVGNDGPRKGLFVLEDAFRRVLDDGYNVNLHIVGYLSGKTLNNLKDLADRKRVVYHGITGDTFPYLVENDLFVIPSLYDSFPNTLLEALYAGIPSCGSNIAGIKVMIEDKELMFEPGSADSLYSTLLKWFNRDFYREKSAFCRERVKCFDFDWIEEWEKVFNNLKILGENHEANYSNALLQ